MTPIISIKGLSKTYASGFEALKDINYILRDFRANESHADDDDIIRIISARAATRPERRLYEEG